MSQHISPHKARYERFQIYNGFSNRLELKLDMYYLTLNNDTKNLIEEQVFCVTDIHYYIAGTWPEQLTLHNVDKLG